MAKGEGKVNKTVCMCVCGEGGGVRSQIEADCVLPSVLSGGVSV